MPLLGQVCRPAAGFQLSAPPGPASAAENDFPEGHHLFPTLMTEQDRVPRLGQSCLTKATGGRSAYSELHTSVSKDLSGYILVQILPLPIPARFSPGVVQSHASGPVPALRWLHALSVDKVGAQFSKTQPDKSNQ